MPFTHSDDPPQSLEITQPPVEPPVDVEVDVVVPVVVEVVVLEPLVLVDVVPVVPVPEVDEELEVVVVLELVVLPELVVVEVLVLEDVVVLDVPEVLVLLDALLELVPSEVLLEPDVVPVVTPELDAAVLLVLPVVPPAVAPELACGQRDGSTPSATQMPLRQNSAPGQSVSTAQVRVQSSAGLEEPQAATTAVSSVRTMQLKGLERVTRLPRAVLSFYLAAIGCLLTGSEVGTGDSKCSFGVELMVTLAFLLAWPT